MSGIHAIKVPQWGLEMTEGSVAEWHVAVGDTIRKGADIVDIETAKIVNVVEAGADLPGVVRRLVAQVGDTLPVGAVLAVVAEPSVSETQIDAFLGGSAVETAAVDVAPTAASFGELPTMDAASLAPAVAAPTTIAPRPAAQPRVEIAPPEAAPPVERVVAVLPATVPVAEIPAAVVDGTPTPAALDPATLATIAAANARVFASPIARRLADRLGIELAPLRGSGVHGRVSVEDVQVVAWDRGHALPVPGIAALPHDSSRAARNALANASPIAVRVANRDGIDLATVRGSGRRGRIGVADLPLSTGDAASVVAHVPSRPAVAFVAPVAQTAATAVPTPSTLSVAVDAELIPFTPMRKAIAAGLVRSKQTIPHFYLTTDLSLDGVLALRAQVNRTADAGDKLSINDFVLRATALALAAVPDVNVHHSDAGILRFRRVHLAVAVAIDGGLVTPVVRDAHSKPLPRLSQEVAALAAKARSRSLTRADLADATFTVSNLGMHGVRNFDAVINPPQGGILAVGAVRREAFEGDGGVAFRSLMSVTLSCDHRVIDGAAGAAFLAELRRRFEQPHMLLL